MARSDDVKGLLGIWQEATGEGEDGLLKLMQHVVQRVLEEELTAYLQAEPHERTEERAGYRNGYKPRTLTTRLGRMELMVPKDREGRFQTELFERCQWACESLPKMGMKSLPPLPDRAMRIGFVL